jgi:GTPase SAR1 family protein
MVVGVQPGEQEGGPLRDRASPWLTLSLLCALQWYPEVTHFCKGVPIIVVGCKTDLRKDRTLVNQLRKTGLEPVTYHRVGSPARW